MACKLTHAGLILLTCLPSAGGRTVYDIPSLSADLGFTPPRTTEFDLTVKVISPCTATDMRFYVTDGTNLLQLVDKAHWPRVTFAANDIIRAKGQIRPKGNPDCLQIDMLGKGAPEPIADATISDINLGKFYRRLVRVHGKIRAIFRDEIDPESASITLCDDAGTLQLEFMPSEDEFRRLRGLVDAEVRVIGIPYESHFTDRGNRRFLPATLSVRSLDSIKILRPAPQDPFSVPEIDAAEFARAGFMVNQRRSAVGYVLAAYGGNRLIVRTKRGDIMNVELAENAVPDFGARIRTVGYPATDFYRINLTDAIWREEKGEPMPDETVKVVSLSELLTNGQGLPMIKPSYHGHAIRISGTVRALPGPGNAEKRLTVESESSNIAVDISGCPQLFGRIEPGCEVEVSGICVMPTSNWHPKASLPRIGEVFIALRTAADLRILRQPPWWTPARLFTLIAALIAGLAAIAVWNRLLKRKVERRSRELLDEQIAHVTSDLKTMERTRLAIELHDSLAQNLTGVALELQTVQDIVREDLETGVAHLATASRSLTSCREELRNCLRDLRSEALETDDIDAAIRMTLDPHMEDANVTIRFNVPRERLTDNTMHALLRIIRELALNAVRHGHASRIKVAGAIEDGHLLFSVADNGCGFDPDNHLGPREGHFGLQGIHERVKGFAGSLKVRSRPGEGSKVTISLKLPTEDRK